MGQDDQPYTSPRYECVDHAVGLGRVTPTVSGAAAEVVARFRAFTAIKVMEARACVMVPGKADTSGFDVFSGTTSIGKILLGTNTAGSVIDASLTDTAFAKTTDLSLKNIVATDTCSAFVYINYEETFPG